MTGVIHLHPRQRVEEVPDDEPDLFEMVSTRVVSLSLYRHVRLLPQLERRVVCWRYGIRSKPKSCAEVASLLGVSETTVRRIEQRGIAALRASFDVKEAI